MVYASDDFAGNGALSANWTSLEGVATRINGEFASELGEAAYYWNATNWTSNVIASLTVGSSISNQLILFVRRDTGANNGYELVITAAGTINLDRIDGGEATNLRTISQSVSSGQVWSLRVVGSTFQVFLNGMAIGAPATDSTYSDGEIGIVVDAALTDTIAEWSAADFTGLSSQAFII